MMARASIPVDLLNPGQVFACLGFMEAAELLLGDVMGAFDWGKSERGRFELAARGEENPIEAVLSFLAGARVHASVPNPGAAAELSTAKWNVPAIAASDDTFPFRTPSTPATLPAVLIGSSDVQLVIDHWGDQTVRDSAKFWAGAGGYPGAGIARDALEVIRNELPRAAVDPYSLSAPLSSGFRLDWRRDYVPIDVGFSPNRHGAVVMLGFPLVELLGSIGLTHARPCRREALRYRYSVLGSGDGHQQLLPLNLHRAALGGSAFPFPQRFFEMTLGWPGQEGQARCILEVTEEI